MRWLVYVNKRIMDAKAKLMTLLWYRWLFGEMGERCSIAPPFYTIGTHRIKLGNRVYFGPGCRVEALYAMDNAEREPIIVIGDRAEIGHRVVLSAMNRLEIGAETLIASGCYIGDCNHSVDPEGPAYKDQRMIGSQTIIGRSVWIGQNVSVLAGAVIGDYAVIGANSVVRGHIPPYSMAVGVPARVIKVYDFEKKAWVRVKPDGRADAAPVAGETTEKPGQDGVAPKRESPLEQPVGKAAGQ